MIYAGKNAFVKIIVKVAVNKMWALLFFNEKYPSSLARGLEQNAKMLPLQAIRLVLRWTVILT